MRILDGGCQRVRCVSCNFCCLLGLSESHDRFPYLPSLPVYLARNTLVDGILATNPYLLVLNGLHVKSVKTLGKINNCRPQNFCSLFPCAPSGRQLQSSCAASGRTRETRQTQENRQQTPNRFWESQTQWQ